MHNRIALSATLKLIKIKQIHEAPADESTVGGQQEGQCGRRGTENKGCGVVLAAPVPG